MKKCFKFLTVLTIVLSLIFTTTVTVSAATVKINKSKISMYVGQTVTLKILNTSKKVSWSSSKKSVATVSSTGKVTAKKAGSVTISGKVNGKKYSCKITVKNRIGSRQAPADAKKGVTRTNLSGKYYFKLNNVYRHNDAVEQLKNMGEWDTYTEYCYEKKEVGTDLLLMEFEVKVLSGFDESQLSGSDIISSFDLYNEQANRTIDDFDRLYLDKNDASDFSLFDGGEGIMYFCAFVPDDLTSFTQYGYTKSFDKYWVKFDI